MWSVLTLAAGADAVNPLVTDLVLVLAASAVVAVALQRLRLALVSAYLIAGAILGPHMLGLVQSAERLSAIADLAIILLMFTIGLQIDLGLIRSNLRMTLLVGVGSVACCWLVGWPFAMLFGLPAPAAMAVSMALSLSSTAVVLRSLAERRELRQPHGRLAFGVLVVQDMAVLLALVLVPILAEWSGSDITAGDFTSATQTAESFLQLTLRAILAISGVAVIIVLGRWMLPRLLGEAARSGSHDLTLIVATASAVGAAMATRWLGFSAELGAFLAGLVLASTPFRHQLSGQIGPLRDVFIAVFFTTLGMRMDVEAITTQWYIVLAGVVVLLALKSAIIFGAVKYGGATTSVAALVGISLAQAGEFSLVVLSESADEGLLSTAVANNLVTITVVSLLLTPALISLGHAVAARLAHRPREASEERASRPEADRSHVVIGGFGPVGRAVAERLDHADVSYTVIELNPKTVRIESSLGRSIVYGDASNPAVLESAGVHDAVAIVLSLPDEAATLSAVQTARAMNPELFIVVRTIVVSKALLARSLGADEVISDELACADAMQRAVRRRLIEERLKRGEHALDK